MRLASGPDGESCFFRGPHRGHDVCGGNVDRFRSMQQRGPRVRTVLLNLVASPERRAAAQNLGWLIAERVGRLIANVVGGLIIARYLGPASFGVFNYAFAMVAVAIAIPQMGLDAPLKRELIRSPANTAELLSATWRLRLIAGALCYAAVLAWSAWGETDATARSLLLIFGLLLFQPALAVADLWLQANLQARSAVIAQLAALSAGLAARVVLVVAHARLWTFAAVAVAEAAAAAGLLTWFARRAGVRIGGGGRALMQRLASEAWPLCAASVAVMIYLRIDVVMLQRLAGSEAAGIYAAAVKISEIWYFLPIALGSSVLPALLRARASGPAAYFDRMQRYLDGSAALAYGLSVPIALLAPWLVRLAYGVRFAAAGPVLALHIWAAVFVFVGVARGQYLVNEGLNRFALLASILGAVVNVGLNFVLIPSAGPMGAAWATVISYALASWAASFLHPRVRRIGVMQLRALLLPITGWRYLRGT